MDQPTKNEASMEPQSETRMNMARPTKAVPARENIVLECSTMALIQLLRRAIR